MVVEDLIESDHILGLGLGLGLRLGLGLGLGLGLACAPRRCLGNFFGFHVSRLKLTHAQKECMQTLVWVISPDKIPSKQNRRF